jgi:hypothetical protein
MSAPIAAGRCRQGRTFLCAVLGLGLLARCPTAAQKSSSRNPCNERCKDALLAGTVGIPPWYPEFRRCSAEYNRRRLGAPDEVRSPQPVEPPEPGREAEAEAAAVGAYPSSADVISSSSRRQLMDHGCPSYLSTYLSCSSNCSMHHFMKTRLSCEAAAMGCRDPFNHMLCMPNRCTADAGNWSDTGTGAACQTQLDSLADGQMCFAANGALCHAHEPTVKTGEEAYCSSSLCTVCLFVVNFGLLLVCFLALAIICDDYLVPPIEHFCETYDIPDEAAGASFLAFGSSAPEIVIATIATLCA